MDVITSRHGLSPFKPLSSDGGVDLSLLSPELLRELRRLEDELSVDTDKLKEIIERFKEELEDGEFKQPKKNCIV